METGHETGHKQKLTRKIESLLEFKLECKLESKLQAFEKRIVARLNSLFADYEGKNTALARSMPNMLKQVLEETKILTLSDMDLKRRYGLAHPDNHENAML